MYKIADDFEKNLNLAQRAYAVDPKNRSSLRSLLEAERLSGAHAHTAPRLHSHSGACALLWMRRNLEFHAALFQHMYRSHAADVDAAAAAAKETAVRGVPTANLDAGNMEAAAEGRTSKSGLNRYSPSCAALMAYGETTSRYHGWALQRVRLQFRALAL